MNTNQQLEEIMSWRFVTEIWRRFPKRFDLIEAHPGGGQYDCLMLLTKGRNPKSAIDVNRGGSVHIHKEAFGLDGDTSTHLDWMKKMQDSSTDRFLDAIANEARLVMPKKLPASTSTTIIYRYISDFLTHSVNRIENWECRNGYEDTSGYGGGVRQFLFDAFPQFKNRETLICGFPIFGEYAYNFWFLLKNNKPILCLNTNGRIFRLNGESHNLVTLYKKQRRIWALISETALDILP